MHVTCQFLIYPESIEVISRELEFLRRDVPAYLAEASKTVLQKTITALHGSTVDEDFLKVLLEKPRKNRRGTRAKVPAKEVKDLVEYLDTSHSINLEKTTLHQLVHLHLEKSLNEGIEKEIRRMLVKEAEL